MELLEHYIKKWSLANPVRIAETATSHVYQATQTGRPVVLKILTALGKEDEADGAIALRHFGGSGAVELLNGDEGAHLLSFAGGRFLKDVAAAGLDSCATEIVCDVLERIHSKSGKVPSGLIPMEMNFRALFSRFKGNENDATLARAVHITERLLETEQEKIVLHGDIHHKNILENGQSEWLAIDPKGLIGERAYDFANVFYNPDDMPFLVENPARIQSTCEIFSRRFGLDPMRILEFAFVYGCLSACWAVEDGLNPARRLRIVSLIQGLL